MTTASEDLLKRITARPDVFNGKPIIRDMRISVELILSLLSQGAPHEELMDDYPELEEEDILACIAYAHAVIAGDSLAQVSEDYPGITKISEALHHDDGKFKSPYAELSSQGPTITDRRLFFVEEAIHTAAIPAAYTTNVRPRLGDQDKITYEGQLNKLEGVVSKDHLFDVYLGECIAPFVALAPLKAALPVYRLSMTMPLNHDDCEGDKHNACRLEVEALHQSMRRRWNIADKMFRDAHENQVIKDLYSNLNHLNKLTSQLRYLRTVINGDETTRVVYTQSGQPIAAIIRDSLAIVDRTLYQTVCQTEEEARYLIAVLNSDQLAMKVKPFCPTNWAKKIRHFEKHGWKLPIPRYEAGEPLHDRLSELGKAAERECQAIVVQRRIYPKTPGEAQSRAARRLLRHEWQPRSKTAQAIEVTVAELLSDPKQAELAKQQMEKAQA